MEKILGEHVLAKYLKEHLKIIQFLDIVNVPLVSHFDKLGVHSNLPQIYSPLEL